MFLLCYACKQWSNKIVVRRSQGWNSFACQRAGIDAITGLVVAWLLQRGVMKRRLLTKDHLAAQVFKIWDSAIVTI